MREGGRPFKPDPNTGSFFLSALPWSGRTNLIADCWTQLGNLLELRAGRALTLQTLQPHTTQLSGDRTVSLLATNMIIALMAARRGSRFELFSYFCFDKNQNRIRNVSDLEEVEPNT